MNRIDERTQYLLDCYDVVCKSTLPRVVKWGIFERQNGRVLNKYIRTLQIHYILEQSKGKRDKGFFLYALEKFQ